MDFSLKTKWLDLVKDGAAVAASVFGTLLLQEHLSLPSQPEYLIAEVAAFSVVINYLRKSLGL